MNTRKALFASKLALVIVLLFVVVRAVLPPGDMDNGLAPASAQGKGGAQVIEKTYLPDLSLEYYAQIVEKNPFGNTSEAASSDQTTLTSDSSVSEELGLALYGTISGSAIVARAIIKDLKTGAFGLYKIGQGVGNVLIESIDKDMVVLFYDGQRKMLRLNTTQPDNYSGGSTQIASPQTINQINDVAEINSPIKKINGNTHASSRPVETILDNAIIEPYVVNDQIEGLKITGLENIKFAKELGLKNGDVIRTVNGHLLTSKQKAYQIFKKARSQEAMTFELLRSDKSKKLSFALR